MELLPIDGFDQIWVNGKRQKMDIIISPVRALSCIAMYDELENFRPSP